jgi:hypothetical protein
MSVYVQHTRRAQRTLSTKQGKQSRLRSHEIPGILSFPVGSEIIFFPVEINILIFFGGNNLRQSRVSRRGPKIFHPGI